MSTAIGLDRDKLWLATQGYADATQTARMHRYRKGCEADGYVGDMMEEDPDRPVRGTIVAHGFDARTRAAARTVANLSLVSYQISFEFLPVV